MPGLQMAHGTWNNPKESQREYHELTGISFWQLGRTGTQTRNEVQLERKRLFCTPQFVAWKLSRLPRCLYHKQSKGQLAFLWLSAIWPRELIISHFRESSHFRMTWDLQVLGWHTGFSSNANSMVCWWLPEGPCQKDSGMASRLSGEDKAGWFTEVCQRKAEWEPKSSGGKKKKTSWP